MLEKEGWKQCWHMQKLQEAAESPQTCGTSWEDDAVARHEDIVRTQIGSCGGAHQLHSRPSHTMVPGPFSKEPKAGTQFLSGGEHDRHAHCYRHHGTSVEVGRAASARSDVRGERWPDQSVWLEQAVDI